METHDRQPSPDPYQRNSKRAFASLETTRASDDAFSLCPSSAPCAPLLRCPVDGKRLRAPAENGDMQEGAWTSRGPVTKRQRTFLRGAPASSVGDAGDYEHCCASRPVTRTMSISVLQQLPGSRRTDAPGPELEQGRVENSEEQGRVENSEDHVRPSNSGSMEIDVLPRTEPVLPERSEELIPPIQALAGHEKPAAGQDASKDAIETSSLPPRSASESCCYAIIPFDDSGPLLQQVTSGETFATRVSSQSLEKAVPLSQMLKSPAVRDLLAAQPADPLEVLGREGEGYLLAQMTRKCRQTGLRRNPLVHSERAGFEKADGAEGARLRTAAPGVQQSNTAVGEQRCQQRQTGKDDVSESVEEATMLEEETLF